MDGALPLLFQAVTYAVLIFFFLVNSFYLLFLILSLGGLIRFRRLNRYVQLKDIFSNPMTKPISIIAPAFNEEASVLESVRSLLSLEYPLFEVIVVNDGSTDATLETLVREFDLQLTRRVFRKILDTAPVRGIYASAKDRKLIVVDKANGKKADALNAGLNVARYPLFCAIDSDSLIERDALLKVVRPFLDDPERTVGVGGIIRLSNGCTIRGGQVVRVGLPRNALARFQVIEYLRAFLGGRMGMSMLNCLLIISGAFGVFRKDLALEIGGYRRDTIGEDMDFVIRLRRHCHERRRPFRISFIPDPICWTEAPENLRVLARQRNRWHRGLIESLVHSLKMLFDPRYGATGLLAMPFYVVFEMLGPLIEVSGYAVFGALLVTGNIDHPFAVRFFLLAVVYGTLLSLAAVMLEELSFQRYPRVSDLVVIVVFGILENFLFRQFLAFVRAKAFVDLLRGKKDWGRMERKGFSLKGERP
ncbi:MAG: glycosyltransferase family 2 protein [Candidatus Aminicenantes bacterium]|nr:glycosyltransferase family 2 protein [Candidatus Aminicenantes bacterium]